MARNTLVWEIKMIMAGPFEVNTGKAVQLRNNLCTKMGLKGYVSLKGSLIC